MTDIDRERFKRIMSDIENGETDYLNTPTKDFLDIDNVINRMKKESRYGTSSSSGSRNEYGTSDSRELDEFLGTGKYSTQSTTSSPKKRRNNKNRNKISKVNKGDFNWDKDKEREKETKEFFAFHDKKFKEFIKKQFI